MLKMFILRPGTSPIGCGWKFYSISRIEGLYRGSLPLAKQGVQSLKSEQVQQMGRGRASISGRAGDVHLGGLLVEPVVFYSLREWI